MRTPVSGACPLWWAGILCCCSAMASPTSMSLALTVRCAALRSALSSALPPLPEACTCWSSAHVALVCTKHNKAEPARDLHDVIS
jgi:hypothetical protein